MILVTGATGNVGRQVVHQLAAAGRPVRALVLSSIAAESVAAESGGAGSDGAESDGAGSNGAIGAAHRVVERAVEASGVEWTHVRPGAFAANALWQWGPSIRGEGVVRVPYPDAAAAPIHEADIAAVAITALLGDGHAGRSYPLSGPESLTQRDQIAILGAALGRDIELVELSPEQAREQFAGAIPGPVLDALMRLWAGAVGRPAQVLPTVEQVTGHKPRTFAQWAAEHADRFR